MTWHDRAVCGGALAAATATGLLRIAADKHYLSDVVGGVFVGFASGYLLHRVGAESPGDRRWTLTPVTGAASYGFTWEYRF